MDWIYPVINTGGDEFFWAGAIASCADASHAQDVIIPANKAAHVRTHFMF
jgi:hypothetical protein